MPGLEGDPIRILHVDDEPDVLGLAKTILEVEDLAFEIVDAYTGEEVLKQLHSEYFDCVVSDYRMPSMDGITLAREIRTFSEVPIILYTGQGSEEVASEAYSAGIDDYVRKEMDPSHFRVLAKRIRHTVERRRSEQIYKGVVEAARDPIDIAYGTTIVYANRAFAGLIGVPNAAELVGQDITDWLAPEDRGMLNDRKSRQQLGEELPKIYEFTLVTKSGQRRRIETSGTIINYRGKPASLNIHRDITEKKRVEEDLHSSKKLLSMALNLTNTGSWVYDITQQKVDWSDQVDKILGYNRFRDGNLSIEEIKRFILPKDLLWLIPKFWGIIRSGRFEETFRITRPDGETRHVIAVGELEKNEQGQFVRVLGSLQDVTERVSYEEKLKAIYRHAVELSRASNMQEVSDSALKAVMETLGFKTCSFHVVEGDAIMTVGGLGVEMKHPYVQRIDGVGVVPRAVRTGETQIIQDITLEVEYEKGPFIGDQQMLSELAVPVHADSRIAAVINLENPLKGAYGEAEKVLIEALAAMIGGSIQRLTQLEMLNSLYMHALEISHSKTVEEIAEATLKAVSRVVNFQTGSFTVIEGRRLRPVYAIGFKFSEGFSRTLDDRGIMVRCARTGETQLVNDTRRDPDYVHGFPDDLPMLLSELAVPIKSGDAVTGIINLQRVEVNGFSEDDREKVEVLALYISAALDLIHEAKGHKEAEEMYRGLLDSTMDGVVVVSGWKNVYVNQQYARMLGYDDASELIGVDTLTTVTPEYRELVETRTESRLKGGNPPSRYSVQLLKKDGSRIDAELNIASIKFNGSPANLTSVRDVTEQRWMEREITEHSTRLEEMLSERTKSLSESEAKYRTLINNLHEGIWTFDDLANTTFVNPRMAQMLGYQIDEMMGRHVTDFVSPDNIDIYFNSMKRRRKGVSEQYDIDLLRKDGAKINVTVGASPIFDEDGAYRGSIAGVVDITERRRLEEQLRESEKQASVGRIASMVGHDLRTPLQTVKNAVALIKRKPKMSEEALKTICEAVDYSTRMLEDLRSVSGNFSPLKEPVNLKTLITEATGRNHLRGISVNLDFDGGPVSLVADPIMMSRVLDNLIKNAVEAMPNGGTLTLATSETGGEAIIEIRDTGVGIPREAMNELFQAFYSTKTGGLGLGLVYCRNAVEAHGGRIEVESKQGSGSTFRVRLPRGDS